MAEIKINLYTRRGVVRNIVGPRGVVWCMSLQSVQQIGTPGLANLYQLVRELCRRCLWKVPLLPKMDKNKSWCGDERYKLSTCTHLEAAARGCTAASTVFSAYLRLGKRSTMLCAAAFKQC